MLTRSQARATWCPMVRIARVEQRPDDNSEVIIGGVNHDALSAREMGHRMAADHHPLASCRCIADKCAMWRWVDSVAAVFVPRDKKTFWPIGESDAAVERMRKAEPTRHAKVPADAVWIPVTGTKDDPEGGYWEEPAEKVDADNAAGRAAAEATMRGYCGLAGRPV